VWKIATAERMSVREDKLSGAERFRVAQLEQRTADRWRGKERKIMMGMVCECVRFAPLAG